MPIKYNTKIFIQKSKEKHHSKYDYSLVDYVNNYTTVKIICSEHGIFEQRPDVHMRGGCCKQCSYEHKRILFSNKIQDFVDKSKKIHDDKYDYSLVDYVNNRIKVKIICPKHGTFEQSPKSHTDNKSGCPMCNKTHKSNTKDFIKKAKEIHGDLYDYSLVKYINAITNIKIICPKHGTFEQTPNNHLSKRGCNVCRSSKGEKTIMKLLDVKNIKYIMQKRFNECKNKRQLPFDFYLPDFEICIEFDGEQHFKSINRFGGEEQLLETKNHDKIKTNFCIEQNIKLIRIRYDESIEYIINKSLL